MTGRTLISADELKALPKGRFIVTKTGCYPVQATLRLFADWGITFADDWRVPEREPRTVAYADRMALEQAIMDKYPPSKYSELLLDVDYEDNSSYKRKPKLP